MLLDSRGQDGSEMTGGEISELNVGQAAFYVTGRMEILPHLIFDLGIPF